MKKVDSQLLNSEIDRIIRCCMQHEAMGIGQGVRERFETATKARIAILGLIDGSIEPLTFMP